VNTFFGLAFLNPEDVGDSFAVDLIPDMPSDNKVQVFADYVLSTYVDDNAMYPLLVFFHCKVFLFIIMSTSGSF
jgi:hypothetical protein